MAKKFASVINLLRRTEQQLEKELAGIRAAISSLSFGNAASMVPTGRPAGVRRRRRTMSRADRAKISAAQKLRWAKQKKAAGK